MKIDELNQKPGLAYLVGGRADKAEPADVSADVAGKPQTGADKVELSGYIPVVPSSERQQGLRVDRVAELKAQIASGTYQVPATAIAEKMIAKFAGSGASN
ncbi:hypothetical protein GMLC_30590 [Geomonas limicola]|uniref:Negative regulator of flagellin synthesis n=1 Tax=Geomonas limicola TaxID=2740186 RepID=A0A6V8NAL2_9BACT|nr:flagellar biosynthesis anti-sigma factor FlgM [Geomonas limicola]GFO69480.1 hypothetical protein GMLC_30590 [Geomonas limicola]